MSCQYTAMPRSGRPTPGETACETLAGDGAASVEILTGVHRLAAVGALGMPFFRHFGGKGWVQDK